MIFVHGTKEPKYNAKKISDILNRKSIEEKKSFLDAKMTEMKGAPKHVSSVHIVFISD